MLVDIDPQASLTTFMRLEPDELETSIHTSIVEGKPLPVMPELIHGMALVPADINLAKSEMQLASAIAREYRLKNALTCQIRLVENLQREDLNPIEETEGILELLAMRKLEKNYWKMRSLIICH